MKKVFLFVALLGFITMYISCALPEKKLQDSGAKLLNQQDLIEFFKEKRVGKGMTSRGSIDIYYFPDRTQKIEHGGGSDEGKYRIDNGQLCVKWKEIRGGAEKCTRMYHIEGNKYESVYLDGSSAASLTFEE
tara:strand:- start:288 stop:683 length:396 start_codon:yes stop_codon:yes gene_type:complete